MNVQNMMFPAGGSWPDAHRAASLSHPTLAVGTCCHAPSSVSMRHPPTPMPPPRSGYVTSVTVSTSGPAKRGSDDSRLLNIHPAPAVTMVPSSYSVVEPGFDRPDLL